jgi:hypothetical protein
MDPAEVEPPRCAARLRSAPSSIPSLAAGLGAGSDAKILFCFNLFSGGRLLMAGKKKPAVAWWPGRALIV